MIDNLEKRLKRQIIGKEHSFIAFIPLGFEQTFIRELNLFKITCNNISFTDGKVFFFAKLTEVWKIVAYSRIANRVLIKVTTFRAENFGRLEKEIESIPWELYFPYGISTKNNSLSFHITSKHSRLYHSDAIEDRIAPIIENKLSNISDEKTPSSYLQNVYANFIDDYCHLWIDLAGEELYKRGHSRFVAEAPLKETIAAAMLFETTQNFISKKSSIHIIDPMAGSGTFSLESAYIYEGFIPGLCRDFALKHQSAFKEKAWNYILKNKPLFHLPHFSLQIQTSDISKKAIEIIQHNIEKAPISRKIINPIKKDFFDYTVQDIPEGSIILMNPPYGKRIQVDAPKLFLEIKNKLKEFKNCNIAILAPKGECLNILKAKDSPFSESNTKEIKTSHGGFSLSALIKA